MGQRLQLQALLEQVLGSEHVYFQPPSDIEMSYPCIVYELDDIRTEFADNSPFMVNKRYQITVIHRDPDSLIPDTIAWFESALFTRRFTAYNLYHSVFTLYF